MATTEQQSAKSPLDMKELTAELPPQEGQQQQPQKKEKFVLKVPKVRRQSNIWSLFHIVHVCIQGLVMMNFYDYFET